MSEFKVYEFEKVYSMITNKLQNESPNLYKLAEMVAYIAELDRGFIVKRQNKSTAKGTKFKYILVEHPDQLKEYYEKLRNMQGEISFEVMDDEIIKKHELI